MVTQFAEYTSSVTISTVPIKNDPARSSLDSSIKHSEHPATLVLERQGFMGWWNITKLCYLPNVGTHHNSNELSMPSSKHSIIL